MGLHVDRIEHTAHLCCSPPLWRTMLACGHVGIAAVCVLNHCLGFLMQEMSAAAKKKLKKKSKRAGADADADPDADAAAAPGKKAAGGKKPSAAVRKMQEALERQQRLQEEARLAAEEAARKVPTRSHAGWLLCRGSMSAVACNLAPAMTCSPADASGLGAGGGGCAAIGGGGAARG